MLHIKRRYSIALVILLVFLMQIPMAAFPGYVNAGDEIVVEADGDSGESVIDSVYGPVIVEEPPSEAEESDLKKISPLGMPIVPMGGGEPKGFKITGVGAYTKPPNDLGNTYEPEGDNVEDPGKRINIGENIAIIFDWELGLDHTYTDGSSCTFDLPKELKHFVKEGDLFCDEHDGKDVAISYKVQEGVVTFNFNGPVDEYSDLKGWFHVWVEFDAGEFNNEDGLVQEIKFADVSNTTIKVRFNNPEAGNGMTKEGTAKNGEIESNMNPSHIDWVVDFNLNEETIENAKFKDTYPQGLTLSYPVKLIPLTVKLDGTLAPGTTESLENTDHRLSNVIDADSNIIGFEINLGDIEKAYRVEYQTDVAPVVETPYYANHKNEAKLSGNSTDSLFEAYDKVYVQFNEPLSKYVEKDATNKPLYNPEKQTIDWVIEYNFNEQFIEEGKAWIKDTFTDLHVLVTDSIKVFKQKINSGGTAEQDGDELELGIDYKVESVSDEPDKNGFKLSFLSADGIKNAYKILYQTVAESRIFDDATINNTVEMYDETKVPGKQDIKQQIFRKSSTGINYNTKIISWKIQLNYDLQEMKDVVITDTFDVEPGMTFLPETLVIKNVSENKTLQKGENATDNTKDYYITIVDEKSQFKIHFFNSIDKAYDITFDTSFDSTNIPKSKQYQNKGKVEWKDKENVPQEKESIAYRDVDAYSKANGAKTGEYDATTKAITWTIDVNYNLHKIGKAVLTDKWDSDMVFANDEDNPLTVHELILEGGANKVKVGDLISVTEYSLEVDEDKKGFTLDLGEITEPYRITYKTSLENTYISGIYKNSATLVDKNASPEKELFKKYAEVTPANEGKVINKTGKQGDTAKGTADIAFWTVEINNSQSHIAGGSYLEDVLCGNQILLADTIKVYHTTVAKDGEITKDKDEEVPKDDEEGYTLVIDPDNEDNSNKFKLTFNFEVNRPYIVEYQSFINAIDGITLENEAEYTTFISNVLDEKQEKEGGFKISNSGAGGGVTLSNAPIKIKKVDDEGNPLAGVKFELYNAKGTILLETLVTDANGEATTSKKYKYKSGGTGDDVKYKLKEVEVPKGYCQLDGYAGLEGKEVPFTGDVIEITNHLIKQAVQLTKVDESDNPINLEGAEFTLHYADGENKDNKVVVDADGKELELIVDEKEGTICANNLIPGKYYFKEVTPPANYVLPSDTKSGVFEIKENQTEMKTVTMENSRGEGSIKVIKVDADDNKPLAGVKFTLKNGDTVIKTDTTDSKGEIEFTNLPYDTYTLYEDKALEGYLTWEKGMEIELDADTNNHEEVVEIENEKNSVTLTKYNTKETQKLKDAVFELRKATDKKDEHGNVIYEVVTGYDDLLTTNADGVIKLEGLEAGNYQLVETKAPAGYKLNSEPQEFEIADIQHKTIELIMTNDRRPSGGGGGTPPPEEPEEEEPEDDPKDDPKDGPKDEPEDDPKDEPKDEPKDGPKDEEEPKDPGTGKPDDPFKEETPKDTPKEGDVEVPEESTPKVGEEPKNGKVTVDENGKWTYTPKPGFVGKDSFTIVVVDEDGNETEMFFEIEVDDVPLGVKELVKTGLDSYLVYYLLGFGLVLLGLGIRRRYN